MTLRVLLILLLVSMFVIFFPRLLTALHALSRIHRAQEAPANRVAIVFGAGLWRDGSPTPVLRDRVRAAAELYFSGKVDKLLMSGTTIGYYNEPRAMRNFALSLGIPNEAIVQDYLGLRTYDTCWRARNIYGIQQATLVTQAFHLPRALYICDSLGIEAQGVSADLQEYRKRSRFFWNLREIPATIVALWEVHVSPPPQTPGEFDPIFPNEAN
jgi:vancomycin permeability regulator SanA